MADAPGCGHYRAWIRDRATKAEVGVVSGPYLADFGYRLNQPSQGSVSIDPTRNRCLQSFDVVPWLHELVFTRTDNPNEESWFGPVTSVSEQPGESFVIEAFDASIFAADAQIGRTWKTSLEFTGDPAVLVERVFLEANLGDHTGLAVFNTSDVQDTVTRQLTAGKSLRRELRIYETGAPWTVIGDEVWIGFIELATGLELDVSHFEADQLPIVTDDGFARVNRVSIELDDGLVVSWPADVDDVDFGADGALLERAITASAITEDGELTAAEARFVAQSLVARSQHSLLVSGRGGSSVDGVSGAGNVSESFPIPLRDLRCGLLVGANGPNLGSVLDVGDVVQISTVDVEIVDGREDSMRVGLSPQFVTELTPDENFIKAAPPVLGEAGGINQGSTSVGTQVDSTPADCTNAFVARQAAPVVVPGPGGITRNIASLADWNAARGAANPGDVIRFTTSLTGWFDWRGDKVSAGGQNAQSGVPGNHITITADAGVLLTGTGGGNGNNAVIDIRGVDHIDVIGVETTSGEFGIRYLAVDGTAASPCRISNNRIGPTGSSHIVAQSWFAAPYTTSSYIDIEDNETFGVAADSANPATCEGIYLGKGRPRWVDLSHHINVRRNWVHDLVAEGIEVKPGITFFEVDANLVEDIILTTGGPVGAINIGYADLAGGTASGALTPPATLESMEGTVTRNRVRNITNLHAVNIGFGGVSFEGNLLWDYDGNGVYYRSEQPFTGTGTMAPLLNRGNTYGAEGWNDPGINPAPALTVTSAGNIRVGGQQGEYVATATDFEGPITGAAVSTGYATGFDGNGSGYQLSTTSGARNQTSQPVVAMIECPGPPGHFGAMPQFSATTGGVVTTAPFTAGTFVSAFAASHAIPSTSVSFTTGTVDKVLLLIAASGPGEVGAVTWNHPAGTVVFTAPGDGFRPRVRGVLVDYTGPTTWNVSVTNSSSRVAVVALAAADSITAGAPVSSTTPTDPAGLANPDDSLGLVVTSLNFTGGAVTAPSAGHSTIANSGSGIRQLHVAELNLLDAGTYDPGAATVGPGNEQGTAIALVVLPE